MKRIVFAILLACLSAGVAYAVFQKTRPANQRFDCEIRWLSHKLELSPEQTNRVRALHLQHCPDMNGLKAELKASRDEARKAELSQACKASAAKLVETVTAELKPEQREKYAALLEMRKQKKEAQKP